MKTVAFDWSGKGIDVTFDGQTSERIDSVFTLLDTLTEPHRIICEATVESYLPDKRAEFIEACASAGHNVQVYHPKYTARYRKANDIEKTDANDALVIWTVGTSGLVNLQRLRATDPEWATFSRTVNREHTIGRFSGETDELVARFEAIISKDTLTDDGRLVFLTKAGDWRSQLVAGVVRASEAVSSRNEFERLIGLSANGYGSHLRSDVVYWGYVGGVAGRQAGPRTDWTTFRRELRRAYHLLQQGTVEPEKGTSKPAG